MTKIHVQGIVAETNKNLRFARECKMLKDVQNGGSQAYKSVRDQSAPPFQAIFQEVALQVVPQKWPKDGRNCLKVQGDVSCLDLQFPVYFQTQECFVVGVSNQHLHLDRHVRWKDANDWRLTQKKVIAEPQALISLTGQAWSEMWLRDPIDDSDENWNDALGCLRSLHDFPSLDFTPLDPVAWKKHAAGVSRKKCTRVLCLHRT